MLVADRRIRGLETENKQLQTELGRLYLSIDEKKEKLLFTQNKLQQSLKVGAICCAE